ncbi:hypothetical protein [Sediminibacterium sp.]|uniref:hypothetical protein n=1 Tax=Sediminibacterium sp. TaxID=1917865 RepID=UPI003F70AA1D
MDLSVLHPVHSPERNYKWKDLLNSQKGHVICRLLEWSGWYNQDISQRLLGHYRLYQVFRVENDSNSHKSTLLTYIVSYKATHWLKYFLSSIVAAIYYVFTFGKRYTPFQIEGINRLLISDHPHILQAFLIEADKDFNNSLSKAVEQITSHNFLIKSENRLTLIQKRTAYSYIQNSSHYFNDYSTIQTIPNSIKGKEKGVFSKKQLLILLDILAENGAIEKIDYSKLNKFDAVATMLQAISGKSKDSILEQLKDTRNNGLYSFQNPAELKQLIITLTNLSDMFRNAGFRSVSNVLDRKLRELDKHY